MNIMKILSQNFSNSTPFPSLIGLTLMKTLAPLSSGIWFWLCCWSDSQLNFYWGSFSSGLQSITSSSRTNLVQLCLIRDKRPSRHSFYFQNLGSRREYWVILTERSYLITCVWVLSNWFISDNEKKDWLANVVIIMFALCSEYKTTAPSLIWSDWFDLVYPVSYI